MILRQEKILNILSKIVFVIYIGLLIWVIMLKCNLITSIYDAYVFMSKQTLSERFTRFLIPFKSYSEDMFGHQIYTIVEDDILNTIVFIPFGLYLSYFIKNKKLIKVLLISFCLSLFFELFQLFSLLGSFETKDFITNVLGAFIGYLLYKLIYKNENSRKKLIILNIISSVGILVFGLVLIYAIKNTIDNFEIYIEVITRRLEV